MCLLLDQQTIMNSNVKRFAELSTEQIQEKNCIQITHIDKWPPAFQFLSDTFNIPFILQRLLCNVCNNNLFDDLLKAKVESKDREDLNPHSKVIFSKEPNLFPIPLFCLSVNPFSLANWFVVVKQIGLVQMLYFVFSGTTKFLGSK